MRSKGCARGLMAAFAGWMAGAVALAGVAVTGGTPKIIITSPSAGSHDVDPSVAEITVTFDRDRAKGCSWTGGGG